MIWAFMAGAATMAVCGTLFVVTLAHMHDDTLFSDDIDFEKE